MIQSDRYLSDKERRASDFPLELNAASAAEMSPIFVQSGKVNIIARRPQFF